MGFDTRISCERSEAGRIALDCGGIAMKAVFVIAIVATLVAMTAVVSGYTASDTSAPHGSVNATDGDPYFVTPTR